MLNVKLASPYMICLVPMYTSLLLALLLLQKVHDTDTMVVGTKLWRFQSYLLIIGI